MGPVPAAEAPPMQFTDFLQAVFFLRERWSVAQRGRHRGGD